MISNVTNIVPQGSFESKFGLLYGFLYTMEDGAVLKANHKTQEPPFKPGDSVEYVINGTNDYGSYGKVSRPEQAPQVATAAPTGPQSYTKGSNSTGLEIARQSSLKIALEYLAHAGYEAQDREGQLQEVCAIAEVFTKWVTRKEDQPTHRRPAPPMQPQRPQQAPQPPVIPQIPPNDYKGDAPFGADEQQDLPF